MAPTGRDATSSCWAGLQGELLAKVFTQIPLSSYLACEVVCIGWRHAVIDSFARQIASKALILLQAKFLARSMGNSNTLVAGLTNSILKHESLTRWLSKRAADFKTICFGTAIHPARLSRETWEALLSALPDSRRPQLQIAAPSMAFSMLHAVNTRFDS